MNRIIRNLTKEKIMSNITKFEQQHKDLETLKAMAAVAVQSGKYSSDYNHATVLNIFMTARALGVDPMLALNGGFNIIKGKINMGAHFMVALARRAGHSIKVVEMTKQKCIIIARRKDNDDSIKYEMDWEEATQAGLTNKDNWQKNPKQMLYCGCVRNVFRMLFSDIAIPYDSDEMGSDQLDTETHLEDAILVETTPNSISSQQSILEPIKTSEELYSALADKLVEKGIDPTRLNEWILKRSDSIGKTLEPVIEDCLNRFETFSLAFQKWASESPV